MPSYILNYPISFFNLNQVLLTALDTFFFGDLLNKVPITGYKMEPF